jgi:chemotaxis protein MotB
MPAQKFMDVQKAAEEAPGWITTFADLMSLLLCFFVLMLSFSETDRQLFKVLSGSLREAFGVQREHRVWDMPKGMNIISNEFKDPKFLADELAKEIRSAIRMAPGGGGSAQVQVEEGEMSVKVTLPGHVLFDLGSAHLKEEALPLLDQLRSVIQETPNRIIVTGHTDDLPIRTPQYPSNWELSAARAGSVIRHFLTKGGIKANRFLAVGMADTLPRVPNDSAVNRAKNRRVEIAFQKPLESLSQGETQGADAWVFDPIFQ